MTGSLLVTFDELINDRGIDNYNVQVNSVQRDVHFTDCNNLYSTYLKVGDVVRYQLVFDPVTQGQVSIVRRDFTTDDENGDRGIKETQITPTVTTGATTYTVTFTATTRPDAYDFYYIITSATLPTPTPTPAPCFSGGTGFEYSSPYGSTSFPYSISQQLDNKYVISGRFNLYNSTSSNFIIKLNSDGTISNTYNNIPDSSSGGGWNAIQPDGKIIVAGAFSSPYRIFRYTTGNTIDSTFISPTGTTSSLRRVKVLSNGKIMVVVYPNTNPTLSLYNGLNSRGLVRLNSDGSIDKLFNPGADYTVNCIEQQTDGKLLIGGGFTNFYSSSQNRIVRLNTDDSIDTGFTINSGFNGEVNNIRLQSNGKIVVCGAFTQFDGTSRSRICRLNSNGTLDTSFVPFEGGLNNTVEDVLIQPDGKIIALGTFTQTISGTSLPYIVRYNTDGTRDTSFTVGTGFNNETETGVVRTDGRILIIGFFTQFNGSTAKNIVLLNTNGSNADCSAPPVPTPTPTPTPTFTPTPTLTSTPTPTPTSTTVAPLNTLVLWWKIENVNTSGGLYQNTIFDYYVSWNYSGTTGQTGMYTYSLTPSSTPTRVLITNSFQLPSYLNNATGVVFTIHRKLCGARPTGQVLNWNRDYIVASNYSSYPASWGQYIVPTTSGCVKTCNTIYNNMSGTYNSRNLNSLPYLHMLIEDKVANSSC